MLAMVLHSIIEQLQAATLSTFVVSIFILSIPLFLVVVQQYVNVSHDYRKHYSFPVIGHWATRTRRNFIWREFRFEVAFSVPKFAFVPRASFYHQRPSDDALLNFYARDDHGAHRPSENSSLNKSFQSLYPTNERRASNIRTVTSFPDSDSDRHWPKQYRLLEAAPHHIGGLGSAKATGPVWFGANDNPWFLRSDLTVPEVKSSWLTLLEDTCATNLGVSIIEKRMTSELMPSDLDRPIASTDRRSFLTLLSLMGVEWRNRGIDDENEHHLSGSKSSHCEVFEHSIPGLGKVYTYRGRDRNPGAKPSLDHLPFRSSSDHDENTNARFYLTTEAARMAMFNYFDLGFAQIRTHSSDEVKASLKAAFKDENLARDAAGGMEADGRWCPGLGEVVACWATPSMAKVITGSSSSSSPSSPFSGQVRFQSRWSSHSCGSFIGLPPVAVLVADGSFWTNSPAGNTARHMSTQLEIMEASQSVSSFRTHVQRWFKSYPDLTQAVSPHLGWAMSHQPHSNNLSDNEISWDRSAECLRLVQTLDKQLCDDFLAAKPFTDDRGRIFSIIAHAQFKRGVNIFGDASHAAQNAPEGTASRFWLDYIPVVVAKYALDIISELVDSHRRGDGTITTTSLEELFGKIIVNRLVRGVLWTLHNGNAPSKYQRTMECSLSSRWIAENTVVYIA